MGRERERERERETGGGGVNSRANWASIGSVGTDWEVEQRKENRKERDSHAHADTGADDSRPGNDTKLWRKIQISPTSLLSSNLPRDQIVSSFHELRGAGLRNLPV